MYEFSWVNGVAASMGRIYRIWKGWTEILVPVGSSSGTRTRTVDEIRPLWEEKQ